MTFQVCDSVFMKMCESTCRCPNIVEKTVNTSNPEITKMICGTFVIIVIVAAITFILWKLISFWAESSKAKRERDNSIEDAKREQVAKYRDKELELLEKKEEKLAKLNSYIQDIQKP